MAEGVSWLTAGADNMRDAKKNEQLDLTNAQSNIETRSKPIQLLGGQKYQIVYKMYHTVSNTLEDGGFSFAYLKWTSEDIDDELIRPEYFYSKSLAAPTKISSFDPSLYAVGTLDENEDAFVRSFVYKL